MWKCRHWQRDSWAVLYTHTVQKVRKILLDFSDSSYSSPDCADPPCSQTTDYPCLIIQLSLILTSPPLSELLNVGLAVESHCGGQRGTSTVPANSTRHWFKHLCSLKGWVLLLSHNVQLLTVFAWELQVKSGVLADAKHDWLIHKKQTTKEIGKVCIDTQQHLLPFLPFIYIFSSIQFALSWETSWWQSAGYQFVP